MTFRWFYLISTYYVNRFIYSTAARACGWKRFRSQPGPAGRPGLPVAPLYYKLNDRTVLISYIMYDEGKSRQHIQKSWKGKGSRKWKASLFSLFFRACTFSICPFCSFAARSFWRVRILRSNNGVHEDSFEDSFEDSQKSGRLSGELRADGLFMRP